MGAIDVLNKDPGMRTGGRSHDQIRATKRSRDKGPTLA